MSASAASPSRNASHALVSIQGLGKSFGGQRANHDISLELRAGRVLVLLGENGAGKSTLMSMLAGTLTPDAGTILVDGAPLPPGDAAASLAAGIGMVHQHFLLMDHLTVAQNVLLGLPGPWLLRPSAMAGRVREAARGHGLTVDPDAPVSRLSMGERQRVEILKLLARDCRVLIFDEPTAVLAPDEAEALFATMASLAAEGKAVVCITHKLPEILSLAARAPVEVAVLRQGEVTARFDLARESLDTGTLGPALIRAMVGREVSLEAVSLEAAAPHDLGEVVLACDQLRAPGLEDVSLLLRRGEILALAGVAGNGQKPLMEILSGLRSPQSGRVTILGQGWAAFFGGEGRGLACIPEDRRGAGMCPGLDLLHNFLLTTRRRFTRRGLLDWTAARHALTGVLAACDVRPADPDALAGRLSGGNLQKLALGREFFRQPRVILAEQPTQGLDVAATEDVWRRLLAMRAQAGILLVTSDLAEAFALADRVAVLYGGAVMGEVVRAEDGGWPLERIGRWMAGLTA